MSTLSRVELEDYLRRADETGLVVTPLLDRKLQINQIGIDLRLSNQFIVFRIENVRAVDPRELSEDKEEIKSIQTEVIVPFGSPFYLHPHTMVLGATFEYVALPLNIEASIEGRSSYGRIGLVIATAVTIEPGYKGCITLELANISNVPIALYPGVRIAQMVCRETLSSTRYERSKKHLFAIGPEFSRVDKDEDGPIVYRLLREGTAKGDPFAPGRAMAPALDATDRTAVRETAACPRPLLRGYAPPPKSLLE